jgi:hypothetical protein
MRNGREEPLKLDRGGFALQREKRASISAEKHEEFIRKMNFYFSALDEASAVQIPSIARNIISEIYPILGRKWLDSRLKPPYKPEKLKALKDEIFLELDNRHPDKIRYFEIQKAAFIENYGNLAHIFEGYIPEKKDVVSRLQDVQFSKVRASTMDHEGGQSERVGAFYANILKVEIGDNASRLASIESTISHELVHAISGLSMHLSSVKILGRTGVSIDYDLKKPIEKSLKRFVFLNEALTELISSMVLATKIDPRMCRYIWKEYGDLDSRIKSLLIIRSRHSPKEISYQNEIKLLLHLLENIPAFERDSVWECLLNSYFSEPVDDSYAYHWREFSAIIRKYYGDGFLVRLDKEYNRDTSSIRDSKAIIEAVKNSSKRTSHNESR